MATDQFNTFDVSREVYVHPTNGAHYILPSEDSIDALKKRTSQLREKLETLPKDTADQQNEVKAKELTVRDLEAAVEHREGVLDAYLDQAQCRVFTLKIPTYREFDAARIFCDQPLRTWTLFIRRGEIFLHSFQTVQRQPHSRTQPTSLSSVSHSFAVSR